MYKVMASYLSIPWRMHFFVLIWKLVEVFFLENNLKSTVELLKRCRPLMTREVNEINESRYQAVNSKSPARLMFPDFVRNTSKDGSVPQGSSSQYLTKNPSWFVIRYNEQ